MARTGIIIGSVSMLLGYVLLYVMGLMHVI